MASVRKKGLYEEHDLADEFLLNQVAKLVKYLKLCSFAKDLGVTQVEYDRITAPDTFTQDEKIHKVRNVTMLFQIHWAVTIYIYASTFVRRSSLKILNMFILVIF